MENEACYSTDVLLVQQVSVCPRLRLSEICLACRGRKLYPDIAYNLCNKLAIYCSKEASKSRTERSIYGLS